MPTLSVWAGGSQSDYMFSLGYPYDRGYAQTIHDFVVSLRDDSKFAIKTDSGISARWFDLTGGEPRLDVLVCSAGVGG